MATPVAVVAPVVPAARLAAWLGILAPSQLRILRDAPRTSTTVRAAVRDELKRRGMDVQRRVWGGGW